MPRTARRATWTCRVVAMRALCGAGQLARALQSWSAYVIADSATVYAKMDTSRDALGSLPKGAAVTVYFAVQSVQGNWCSIALKSERQESGFVDLSPVTSRPGSVGISQRGGRCAESGLREACGSVDGGIRDNGYFSRR